VYAQDVNKRINIVLPASTVAVLDKVAPKGNRSALIDQAVRHYVRTRSRQNLRERLKEEALTNTQRDVAMTAEWFPMEEEAWQLARGQKKKE
jgi:metal-responsive CopG/Arc/MetJ family transcriptional regulator